MLNGAEASDTEQDESSGVSPRKRRKLDRRSVDPSARECMSLLKAVQNSHHKVVRVLLVDPRINPDPFRMQQSIGPALLRRDVKIVHAMSPIFRRLSVRDLAGIASYAHTFAWQKL